MSKLHTNEATRKELQEETLMPYRNGKVHICSEKCETCIFRPGNRMHLMPGRVKDMVRDSLRKETAIICHSTLDGAQAVCRGFFDRYETTPLRLAKELKAVTFIQEKAQ